MFGPNFIFSWLQVLAALEEAAAGGGEMDEDEECVLPAPLRAMVGKHRLEVRRGPISQG